jgi:phosphoribosyl-ATP pyrophosphohydrolase/phosphoribosyl-AMP cyclohydrolase/histidinol dehydrogenase
MRTAEEILGEVQRHGDDAVRQYAERFNETLPNRDLLLDRDSLKAALTELDNEGQERLERIAKRIGDFALAQRRSVKDVKVAVPGGKTGHRVVPVPAVGAYAPGGRYPLPSSVLMTVIPARIAGVRQVCVASPRPTTVTLAAAAVAGADLFLCVGGAQAVAALAHGYGSWEGADVVVGPGNGFVTAAKQHISKAVRIDIPAGPSELVLWCDETSNPQWVAADLLAQAEHDPCAWPVLLVGSEAVAAAVVAELEHQLETLPTAETARSALQNGGILLVGNREDAMSLAERLAPEHLQLCGRDAEGFARNITTAGSVFIGSRSAEAFGDYGIGPNHTLPTLGSATSYSGLSVLTFLRWQTFIELQSTDPEIVEDTAWLARAEGLEAHARAAEVRRDG